MTEQQLAYIRKAADSIRAAELLLGDGFSEFAVSRAYYAMFYIAEAFLLAREMVFNKHSAVISAFGQYFVKTGVVPQEFHKFLLEAHGDRLVGDYDTQSEVTANEAREHIERAARFVELANERL